MEEKKRRIYYAAFRSKDRRFDGQFFVGISSTGIYCRPICRARLPKEENCRYFKTAAEAEQAGFRPCLLCRPELAPEKSFTETGEEIAIQTARLLEEHCGSGVSITVLAKQLACTDRHLRRVFAAAYHVTPVAYLQTCRLLLAKSLLTDTDLSILEVAMAAGFGSLRRFNELFKKQYHLAPTALRKELKKKREKNEVLTVGIGYHPPYEWKKMLDFFSLRAIPGVEVVQNDCYMRTMSQVDRQGIYRSGWIKVKNNPVKSVLLVTLSDNLITVIPQILGRIKCLFDVYCDPEIIYTALLSMNTIKSGLCVKGTRVPGCINSFELAVRAVLGQQITIKAAKTLAGRFAETFGTPIETTIQGLSYVFPTAEKIVGLGTTGESKIASLGIISTRARTIKALAQLFYQEDNYCQVYADPEKEIKKLLAIPGIGVWTAGYIAMRAMGCTDIFLETDYGIKKAMEPMTTKEMLQQVEKWRPWRSYAVMNLWDFLSEKGH